MASLLKTELTHRISRPWSLRSGEGEVHRLMDRWKQTGEELGGGYFTGWDDLIVRDPGIPAMLWVVDHLVQTGDYPDAVAPCRAG